LRDITAVPLALPDAQAHFAEDQTDVHSEFVVQTTEVLKNDDKAALAVGNSVTLERSGGRVRFPSGKVMVSATNHQDLPRVGKRYLFFLSHEGLTRAFMRTSLS
jgi:hypothetical protein